MGVSLKFIGGILDSVKSYTSLPKVWTTNLVFQLHCNVSALILFTSCIFVTAGQFFGDPIDCIVDKVHYHHSAHGTLTYLCVAGGAGGGDGHLLLDPLHLLPPQADQCRGWE